MGLLDLLLGTDPNDDSLKVPEATLTKDLSGKTYIVTGGNGGIGFSTSRQLAKQNATVVLACRRLTAGEDSKEKILAETPEAKVDVMALDVSSLKSVKEFAEAFNGKYDKLHCLLNNAGIMNTPEGSTTDGFEIQFGTNHVGPFLLTELLLPKLKASAPSRVVCTSSCYADDKDASTKAKIHFEEDFMKRGEGAKPYDGWAAYLQSKLANLLHAQELSDRLKGTGVAVVALHPGFVESNLLSHTVPLAVQSLIKPILVRKNGMITPENGAQTSMYCCIDDDIMDEAKRGCGFYSQAKSPKDQYPSRPELRVGGWPLAQVPNPLADDAAYGKKLYTEVVKQLNGLGYTW